MMTGTRPIGGPCDAGIAGYFFAPMNRLPLTISFPSLLCAASAHALVGRQPKLQAINRVAIHPAFRMDAMMVHRATADVALLQLAAPVAGKAPAALGAPTIPVMAGSRFTIAGIGVTVRGDGKSGGTIRVAGLVATGKPGTLQIRLVDPVGQGAREGMGACTGDSGGPVVEDKPTGPAVIGVISWSTGPNGSAGCGGMTGVTPLTLYRDWILQTAQQWGAGL